MAKTGLSFINEDTGEVIDNVVIKLNDEYYDPSDVGFKMTANFKNNEAKKRNIRVYRVNTEEQISQIDLDTEYDCEYTDGLKKRYKFAKMYQDEDPMFSKDSYYKYWVKICCCLKKDTNVIYNREPTLHKVDQIGELEGICDGSHTSISRFMKECFAKGLIAEFRLKGKKEFVVNPKYVLNGKKMPILLFNLFNEEDVNDNCERPFGDMNE